jgi:hypothetical protein
LTQPAKTNSILKLNKFDIKEKMKLTCNLNTFHPYISNCVYQAPLHSHAHPLLTETAFFQTQHHLELSRTSLQEIIGEKTVSPLNGAITLLASIDHVLTNVFTFPMRSLGAEATKSDPVQDETKAGIYSNTPQFDKWIKDLDIRTLPLQEFIELFVVTRNGGEENRRRIGLLSKTQIDQATDMFGVWVVEDITPQYKVDRYLKSINVDNLSEMAFYMTFLHSRNALVERQRRFRLLSEAQQQAIIKKFSNQGNDDAIEQLKKKPYKKEL